MYSKKIRAGKRRTYYIDVLQTRGDDYYLSLTEHARRLDGDGYERHKIYLYKEDFNRFAAGLQEVLDHVKTKLMPDYDYDEFTRRHEEYENSLNDEQSEQDASGSGLAKINDEDDMGW